VEGSIDLVMSNLITFIFPFCAIILSTIAYVYPSYFTNLQTGIVPLLTIIMFGMGMTLKPNDFKTVLYRKKVLLVGLVLQYGIMPLTAFVISLLLNLPSAILIGMVLVGTSSGGTASNVICYLARADVALSISMTILSTFTAIFLMPTLTWLYVQQTVPVPVLDMCLSVLKIILIPVLIGVVINSLWGKRIIAIKTLFPLLSAISIILVIAIIVAVNQPRIAESGRLVAIAVVFHNGVGLFSGWLSARLLGFDNRTGRTLSIEIGMQNSGLSAALALKYFSTSAAIPAAIFSIWHNISGSLLASYWNKNNEYRE
tara:strand:+ start:153 stop:1094 length:942 start_codon:yes stop_codon:yes gene_type:complete